MIVCPSALRRHEAVGDAGRAERAAPTHVSAAALWRRLARSFQSSLRREIIIMALRSDLDMLPSRSCGSRRHVVQLRVDRLRACVGGRGWERARSVRAFQAARVGMRRVQRFRRCVEHGRSQDDVIRTARAVAEKKIGLLYVCACVRKSSNMSPIASPDLVSSCAMDHDHREPPDRPFKICRFFLLDPLLLTRDLRRYAHCIGRV